MNTPLILKALGAFFLLLAIALNVPLLVAHWYDDGSARAFAITAILSVVLGAGLFFVNRSGGGRLSGRAALLVVGSVWCSFTVLGALPFYLSGFFPSFVDAWFESASGFTTTGASVITNIEALPQGVLVWRSLTQWLGGMGVIVLSVAVLPLLGAGGMDLYRAEAPGPTTDKLTARITETAQMLWIVYVTFTLLEIGALVVAGMSLFDAVNHSFTTMSTGGFSTKNASIASFNNPMIEAIITVFMFMGGMNFVLHYRLFVKRETSVFKDPELRFYLTLVFSSCAVLTMFLWVRDEYKTFSQAVRYACFQVSSIITTTGYGTADFASWGSFGQFLLLLLMVIGGCAGSTSGGLKCIRGMLLIKQGARELHHMVHPRAVLPLKIGGKSVSRETSSAIFGHLVLYLIVLVLTALFITATGVDLVTAVSATISAISNVGPGLGEVGPVLNYSGLPDLAKMLLSACMIIGRLELYTILVLLTAEFWER